MLDRDGLHQLLFDRADGAPLRVDQGRLADELCVSKFVINRTLKAMCAEGRIVQETVVKGPRSRVFEVTDPAEWLDTH